MRTVLAMNRAWRWVAGSLVACALVGAAARAAVPDSGESALTVDAQASGAAVEIHARAVVQAPHAVIWSTLTDYDRQSAWIPGMASSRVLARQGDVAVVEQSGRAEVWLFSYPIHVVVESREQPPDAIQVRVLRGNLRRLDGGYRLVRLRDASGVPGPERYELSWRGRIESEIHLPALLSVPLMRSNLRLQFQGMLDEIGRRAGSARRG
jgi:hypothetical protein